MLAAEAVTAGKLLKSETIAAEQIVPLMVSQDHTILRVNVNFSTVRTRAGCQRRIGVTMATFPLVHILPISLPTDDIVWVIYHRIKLEPDVFEFISKCLTTMRPVMFSQLCVVFEILSENVLEIVVE